jgi:hypothetical protein
VNNHDLSPEGLGLYLTANYIDSASRNPRQDVWFGRSMYYAGPLPFRVGDITLQSPDRAHITACVVEWQYSSIDHGLDDPADFDARTEGGVAHFWLDRGDDGRIRLVVDAFGGSPCPLGNARAGYFDPQPDPSVIPGSVTMPDGTVIWCGPELSKGGCPPGDEPRPPEPTDQPDTGAMEPEHTAMPASAGVRARAGGRRRPARPGLLPRRESGNEQPPRGQSVLAIRSGVRPRRRPVPL